MLRNVVLYLQHADKSEWPVRSRHRGVTKGFLPATKTPVPRMVTHPRLKVHVTALGSRHQKLSSTPACLPLGWLGPRRDAKQQHLAQGPDVVGHAGSHGWRTR